LLIPAGHRQFESDSFHLDVVYISPVLVTQETATKKPAFCTLDETGMILIQDALTNATMATIQRRTHTGVIEEEKLFFFDDGVKPVIELLFPTADSASDAFNFSLNPPRRGFMQLASFLHSVSAFETYATFFVPKVDNLPAAFTDNLKLCASDESLQLMLYAFMLQPQETKVTNDTIDFFLDLIGDSIFPFLRALTQLKWEAASYMGQLVFRQNSAFTTICGMMLRKFAGEYSEGLTKECSRLLETHGGKIKSAPLSDDEDTFTFLDNIFDPFTMGFMNSAKKAPPFCRVLHRLLVVRTSGFYINQNAAFIVIANLLLLRFIIPPIATEGAVQYGSDPKMKKVSALVTNAMLSICNELGWPEDKEPYLAKFRERIERYYPKMEAYMFDLIDCHEFDYDKSKLTPKGTGIELLSTAAKRLIFMNVKEANSMIRSHVYKASIMHMIEEYVYDFRTREK
jgi:hypothetical protein